MVPRAVRANISHHLDPAGLAGLAMELYGRVPPISVVSVGAESFDGTEKLSPATEAALPNLADEVARLLSEPAHA